MENNEIYEKEKISTDKFSCPNCGGLTEFDPVSGKLKCVYCFTEFSVETERNIQEKELDILLANAKPWTQTEVVQCESCGAKQITVSGDISSACPFCGTTNIIKTKEIIGMTPDGLCPFEKTQSEAGTFAEAWAKKKFFAPRKFKKSVKAEGVKGVYTPAFAFDCDTYTKYDGKLGERKTRTHRGRDGKLETETYIDYFHVSGNLDRKFDDLLVHTSSSIPNKMITKIEPYPTAQAVNYDQKYLAGYVANTYAKDGKTSWEESQGKMENIIRKEILGQYHHDTVSYLHTDIQYKNSKFKYLLLPVYVGHHAYKGKHYNFYVNGSTGKVAGKAPVSGWKVFFTVLLGLAAVSAFVLLGLLG